MRAVDRVVEAVAPARMGSSFRWLVTSVWATNLADGIALAAGPLLVASQSRDPFLVALAVLLQRLPWLLFGLHAGVVADRVDRRRLVVAVNLARVAVLVVLCATIVTGTVGIAVVLVTMFVLGTAETFADTATDTLLPMVVPKGDLGLGNARLMAGFVTTNQLVGPPVGAALFAAGLAWPFVTQATFIVLGALLATRVAVTAPAHGPGQIDAEADGRRSVRREIRAGLAWTWGHPSVRTLALTILTFNVTFGAAWAVLVLYSLERLRLGELGFGLLTSVLAVGGLLGSASYGRLTRRWTLGQVMRGGLVIEVTTHLVLALTRTPWVAMTILFVFGAHGAVWGTTAHTVRQRAVPTELQGRVGSVYRMALFGGIVIGSALGGVIAAAWGVTAPFWFGFVGSAVILAAIWRQLPRIASDDQPAGSGTGDTDEIGANDPLSAAE